MQETTTLDAAGVTDQSEKDAVADAPCELRNNRALTPIERASQRATADLRSLYADKLRPYLDDFCEEASLADLMLVYELITTWDSNHLRKGSDEAALAGVIWDFFEDQMKAPGSTGERDSAAAAGKVN